MESKAIRYDNLTVSSSPHLVTSLDTTKTMLYVVAALMPAALMSIVYFGIPALVMILLCMVSCAFFEWIYERLLGKASTVRDGSALVTGLILALNLPANLTNLGGIEYPVFMPYLICIIGSFVAIVVVKQIFGGLGRNFANPAIVARITLLVSFTSYMSTWPTTRFQRAGIEIMTGATPLANLAEGNMTYAPSLRDIFLGNIGGAMGETCALAILIGAIFLIAMKIISPIIPVSFVGTVFVFSFLYYAISGTAPEGLSPLYMACFHVFAGGVMFGAVFCATDYVTSPIMPLGKLMFGIGCGLVTMIIRLFCSYPEGVSFAILFMNIMTPHFDEFAQDRLYGISKRKKEAAAAAKENKAKNKFAAPVIVLSSICLVVSLALAFTYKIANPIIIENQNAVAVAARKEVLPDADDFTQDETVTAETGAKSADGKASVQEVFAANNGTGYVMTVNTTSFGGELTMMVGLDAEGAVTGVKVTVHADTPGVGTKNMEPSYLSQYSGISELTSASDVKKESAELASGGSFAFISGASVTGQAIHSGVDAALSQYAAMGGAQ